MTLAALHRALVAQPHHVSPFLVLGDPTPAASLAMARAAVAAGGSMLELGFPFSDPCADGPAIQAACLRARAAGVSTGTSLALLASITDACPGVPCNLLVYGNLVHARGPERFCRDVAAAGGSSLLVPDVPLEEGAELYLACRRAGLGIVQLVGPRTAPQRLPALAAESVFLYVAALQGVTGAAGREQDRAELLARVRAAVSAPLGLGFGLASAADVAGAFAHGAAIAVIGSHLARAIETAWTRAPGDEAGVVAAFTAAFRPLVPPAAATAAFAENHRCS